VVDPVLAQQAVEERHELVEAVDALLERAFLAEDARVEVTTGAEAAAESGSRGTPPTTRSWLKASGC
jgi:hypothetical protein